VKTPPIVSAQDWDTALREMLVKEKEFTRARDALAAMRRRMPWTPVDKAYEFEGPEGTLSLLDLFQGRRQLIVYRAFVDPGVHGWPEHGCVGCSLMADHIGNLAHLNARDTMLVYASRGSQADIERVKARMGWTMPWYTMTDGFDNTSRRRVEEVIERAKDADIPLYLLRIPRGAFVPARDMAARVQCDDRVIFETFDKLPELDFACGTGFHGQCVRGGRFEGVRIFEMAHGHGVSHALSQAWLPGKRCDHLDLIHNRADGGTQAGSSTLAAADATHRRAYSEQSTPDDDSM
jgi:hypothetical protein